MFFTAIFWRLGVGEKIVVLNYLAISGWVCKPKRYSRQGDKDARWILEFQKHPFVYFSKKNISTKLRLFFKSSTFINKPLCLVLYFECVFSWLYILYFIWWYIFSEPSINGTAFWPDFSEAGEYLVLGDEMEVGRDYPERIGWATDYSCN